MKIMYLNSVGKIALDELVSLLCHALGIKSFEKRESDIYQSGYYFKLKSSEYFLKVYETDSESYGNFQFTLAFQDLLDESDDKSLQVAEACARMGFKVAMPEAPFKGSPIQICEAKADGGVKWSQERVQSTI